MSARKVTVRVLPAQHGLPATAFTSGAPTRNACLRYGERVRQTARSVPEPPGRRDGERVGGEAAGAEAAAVPGPARARPECRPGLTAALYAAALTAFVVLRLHAVTAVEPRHFRDTSGYLRIARLPLADPRAWAGTRPFLVPLLYRVLQGDARRIVLTQLALSIAAWAALAVAMARAVRSAAVRVVVFGLVLMLGLATPIILWDGVLLSESVALSLTALVVAAGLALLRRWTALGAVCFVGLAAGLAAARDVAGYALLILAVVIAGGAWRAGSRRRRWLAVAGALIVVAGLGMASALPSKRWLSPSLNVLTQRILPDEARRGYFVERGMPVSPALLRLSGRWPRDEDRALYRDPGLEDFRRWWLARGRLVYAGLLLTHPAYLVGGPAADLATLVSPRVARYAPAGFTPVLGAWPDGLMVSGSTPVLVALGAAALGSAVALWRRRRWAAPWLVPLALVASAAMLAAVTWHGDAMEVGRHALPVAVHLRLGVLLALALAADEWIAPAATRTDPRA